MRSFCGRDSGASEVIEVLAATATEGVIWFTAVVFLEVCFEPLTELEVVLVLSLNQLGHLDMSLDSVLVKGLLEHFVVFDEFVVILAVPSDLVEAERFGIKRIQDSAIDRASGTLFDLGKSELIEVMMRALTSRSSLSQFRISTLPTK